MEEDLKAVEKIRKIIIEKDGAWWFWDETWTDLIGPYKSEKDAKKHFKDYCRKYLGA